MRFLRSRLRGALPTIAVVMTSPAVASACGYCTDTMIEQHGWWTVFPFWVAGALLVDLVWVSVARRLRRESGHERVWPMMVALGLGLLIVVAGGGLIAFAFIVSIPLLARLVRSLREMARPGDRRLLRVRVAVLALAVGAAAFLSRPAAISTETLIHRELHGFVSTSGLSPNWMEKELGARPEALAELERRIVDALGNPPSLARLDARLLRLHVVAGGRDSSTKLVCRLVEAEREKRYRPRLAEICQQWKR